jgi:CBS domain-containing protein
MAERQDPAGANQVLMTLVGNMQAAAEGARRSARAESEAMSGGLRSAAQQTNQMTRGFADATEVYGKTMQAASRRLHALTACSQAMTESLPRAQQASVSWFSRTMQTNARFAQDLLRCRTLSDVAQVQSRFVEETITGLVEGSAELLRRTEELLAEAVEQIEEAEEPRVTAADVMTPDVHLVSPDDTIQKAARIMGDEDTGALPVGEEDKLVGMVTDRDIAVRVAAAGADSREVKVRDVMSPGVTSVYEDEGLHRVAEIMATQQVRRVPVMDRDDNLVGIISLGDIAVEELPEAGQQALLGVSQEGGRHVQDLSQAAGQKPRRKSPQRRKAARR